VDKSGQTYAAARLTGITWSSDSRIAKDAASNKALIVFERPDFVRNSEVVVGTIVEHDRNRV
jgi:hypothetical protein